MSSIGTGYDLSASQFSPDGRVFQVEYAQKAVENSGDPIFVVKYPLAHAHKYAGEVMPLLQDGVFGGSAICNFGKLIFGSLKHYFIQREPEVQLGVVMHEYRI